MICINCQRDMGLAEAATHRCNADDLITALIQLKAENAALKADQSDWRKGVALIASGLGESTPPDLCCVRLSEVAMTIRAENARLQHMADASVVLLEQVEQQRQRAERAEAENVALVERNTALKVERNLLRASLGEMDVRLSGVEAEKDHYRTALAKQTARVTRLEGLVRAGLVLPLGGRPASDIRAGWEAEARAALAETEPHAE